MSNPKLLLLCLLLCTTASNADVWRWVDAEGNAHYVDTLTSIFTWVDEAGRIFYSDTPDHEGAVAVELVWHSSGELGALSEAANEDPDGMAFEEETPQQKVQREQAEEHLCEHARDAYDSYKTAERLYVTNEDGEKEYLSKRDMKSTMKEAQASVKKFCS